MILYNTLMGVCAGMILWIAARLVNTYTPRRAQMPNRGTGLILLILGIPLTLLGALMTTTWPLHVNPPINIAFGEPSFMLGLMSIAGGIISIRQMPINTGPFLNVVCMVGFMLLAISIAIFRFKLVGDAPDIEPITGQFKGWENTTFGVVYLWAATGCIFAPLIDRPFFRIVVKVSWGLAGTFFLAFSLLNYYTHIGMLMNVKTGAGYQW